MRHEQKTGVLLNEPAISEKMVLQGLKVVSLFSGAGGLDLGLIRAGHHVIWANDSDEDSVATYRRNIGNHIVHEDIAKVPPDSVPDHDLLVGGFPCQGFSRANIHRVENDDRNDLYVFVVRILREKKPRFFLLENVRGIKSLNGGQDFREILLALEDSGYQVQHATMNAADYGVPQNRIRVIITGVRKDLTDRYVYEYPMPTHSRTGANGHQRWLSVGEVLENIPDPENDGQLMNHVYSKYRLALRDFTGHRPTDASKPSPTILARGNGKGGVCAIPHPKNHRRMSVRESALVQTFPLDFVFEGNLGSMYRQVGNAVAVEFAERLGHGFKKICNI
jgi:DNA (cytosine-5)-methyltransferase 1